tara:strand:+ start:244 stop:678 length:435 start_codon:yes stop_codon:yes gene_type:complete
MKNNKIQEAIIILSLILLFSYLIFKECINGFYIIEGNENKEKTPEEIEKEVAEKLPKIIAKIEKDCDDNIFDPEKKFNCKRDGVNNAKNKLRAQIEAKNITGDMDSPMPTFICPEVKDFYTLLSKSKCLADKMREGVSIGNDIF